MATIRDSKFREAGLRNFADDYFMLEIYEGNTLIGKLSAQGEDPELTVTSNRVQIPRAVVFPVNSGITINKIILRSLTDTTITVEKTITGVFFESVGLFTVNSFYVQL